MVGKNQRGASIVTVLVAVGISGVLAAGMTSIYSNMLKMQKRADLLADKTMLKQALHDRISCTQTLLGFKDPVTECKTARYIALKTKSGSDLVAEKGSKVGTWFVRARCTSSGLDIRSARPKDEEYADFTGAGADKFRLDPVTDTPFDWQHEQAALFKDGLAPCTANFATANAPAGPCKEKFCPVSLPAYKVAVGALRHVIPAADCPGAAPPIQGRHYTSVITCPIVDGKQWVAAGGGAECQIEANPARAGGQGGYTLSSRVLYDANGLPSAWFSDCCGWTNLARLTGNGTNAVWPNYAFAICVPPG